MRTLGAAETARPVRRDPAPSRLSYRAQRLWLTPTFRALLRHGFPAIALVAVTGWLLHDTERRDALAGWLVDLRTSVEQRPEFQVHHLAITGASDELVKDIRSVFPVDFPISSFHLDLPIVHEVVAGLDAVAHARLSVQTGGILTVEITEREPAVVFQTREVLALLDAEGHRVAPIEARAAHAKLPLIAGMGGDAHVPEALALIEVARPLQARLVGIQRMGERRWDIVLTNDQRILLPEDAPEVALQRVLAMNSARKVLTRDIHSVDMRDPERPTLRLRTGAVDELWRIRELRSDGRSE